MGFEAERLDHARAAASKKFHDDLHGYPGSRGQPPYAPARLGPPSQEEVDAYVAYLVDKSRADDAKRLDDFMRRVGPRYGDATIDGYIIKHKAQQAVVEALRGYTEHAYDNIRGGRGVILYGPTGTGKDHLLIGMARVLIPIGCEVMWTNGSSLYADLRASMGRGAVASEDEIIEQYSTARVLVLSDPLPPTGPVTPFQADAVYRILDHRYRNCLPTWCSVNVAGVDELRERLGAAATDRLRDGALALHCSWPSHRKAVSSKGQP